MLAVITKQLCGEPKALDDRYIIGPFDERLKSKHLHSEIISRHDLIIVLLDHIMYLPNNGNIEVRIQQNSIVQPDNGDRVGLDLHTRIEVYLQFIDALDIDIHFLLQHLYVIMVLEQILQKLLLQDLDDGREELQEVVGVLVEIAVDVVVEFL